MWLSAKIRAASLTVVSGPTVMTGRGHDVECSHFGLLNVVSRMSLARTFS